jgi:hypothetical protein
MADKPKESKRVNRAVGVAEALKGTLDPFLRKRGFANRDILLHWPAIAPKPYDTVAIPDKLTWPRGERSAEGATLYLRCLPAHALALAHEGEKIAAAVNRYFGYVLVSHVRQSLEPFSPHSAPTPYLSPQANEVTRARIGRAVSEVPDDGLKEALRQLGHGILGKTRR